MDEIQQRYAGKPFLRLLDAYVLWAIGELDEASDAAIERMAPDLRATYATDGQWQDIVAKQMDFSESMPGALRDLWVKARTSSAAPAAREFAMAVVDENFL